MKRRLVCLRFFLSAILAVVGGMLVADRPALGEERNVGPQGETAQGPLVGLPSAPGRHIARIKDLADDSWLDLGAPASDPKWGRARGRSWTAKMPFVPELRGAFLAGQGVHGYVKPDGHYQDDLWFYDINGHRWICCYPGADVKKLDLKVNADGFEVLADSQLIPVAWLGHGYEMSTYDPDSRRLLSIPCGDPYWEGAIPQRKRWLKAPPGDAGPWSFELQTARWHRSRTGTPGPQSSFGDLLVYVPTRKQVFFAYRSSEVWFYDPKANKWQAAKPKGPNPPFGIDATCCYDSKRDRIYLGGGGYPTAPEGSNALWIYDLKNDTWIDPKPAGAPCKGLTHYGTNNAFMVYDMTNDMVLLVYHSLHSGGRKECLGVYVYDPATNSWSARNSPIPGTLGRDKCKNGFYDSHLNAVFVHAAGDSRDDSVMCAYRYKKAEE